MAVAAVAATIATGGAALAAVGPAAGGVAAGAATAAGFSAATATAVGATASAVAVAGVTAGATSLAATSAITLANNQGSLNETLGDVASRDTVESVGKSMAIAALTAGIANMAVGGAENVSAANNVNNTTVVTEGSKTLLSSTRELAMKTGAALRDSAIESSVSAAVETMVEGKSFGDGLKNGVKTVAINAVAQVGAETIGGAYHTGKIGKVKQLTAHAVVGCAAGAAASGNCGAGAAGAVVGEVVGDYAYNQNGLSKESSVALAEISGAVAGGVVGDSSESVYAGSRAGKNSAENNAVKVWVQEVALGQYHTSIKVEPENQEKYADDERFNNVDPETGKRYATIGAGPDSAAFILGNLIGGDAIKDEPDAMNRSKDTNLLNKVWESTNIVKIKDEDTYINNLFSVNGNYKNNLKYGLFPTQNSGDYNSNSYTAGLLNASGVKPPPLPSEIHRYSWQPGEGFEGADVVNVEYSTPKFPTPGYNKPVPIENFQEVNDD